MTTLMSVCRKFSPNIFVQTKCQNCFRTKDVHSADALDKWYREKPTVSSSSSSSPVIIDSFITQKSIISNKRKPVQNNCNNNSYNNNKVNCDKRSTISDVTRLKSSIAELESISEQASQLTNEIVCCRYELIQLRKNIREKEEDNLDHNLDQFIDKNKDNKNNEQFDDKNIDINCNLNDIKTKEDYCLEISELKAKRNRDLETIKKLNVELKEAQSNYDYLEITYERLTKKIIEMEKVHESDLNSMKDRINDLTQKLFNSERLLRLAKQKIAKYESRQERRRSSLKGKT